MFERIREKLKTFFTWETIKKKLTLQIVLTQVVEFVLIACIVLSLYGIRVEWIVIVLGTVYIGYQLLRAIERIKKRYGEEKEKIWQNAKKN